MWKRDKRSKRVEYTKLIKSTMILLLICLITVCACKMRTTMTLSDAQKMYDGAESWDYGIVGNGEQNAEDFLYTSTESVLEKSYAELIESLNQNTFQDYISTLKQDVSYVIPGLNQTNIKNEKMSGAMVPQGVCVAGSYLIISAYDKCEEVVNTSSYMRGSKSKSVLYIMDAESEEYLTTISLNTDAHVGALAYNPDDKLIYIADSKNGLVQKLSLSKIELRVNSGEDTEFDVLEFDDGAIDTQGYVPSFITYYQEHIYVGRFAKINFTEIFSNQMAVFTKEGNLLKEDTITIPYYAQGVSFAEWEGDTYMLVSTSYGRKRSAKLCAYLMESKENGALWCKNRIGAVRCPNMSEDIEIQGDCIYTCYESAANFYRLAMDGKGESTNAVDRILVSSLGEMLSKLTTNMLDGNSGQPLPWSDDAEHITIITMDVIIESIGADVLDDSSNRKHFSVSDFSNLGEIYILEKNMFSNCSRLKNIKLPDKVCCNTGTRRMG